MNKIEEFLKETNAFFLATCDGGQPKCRPLGLHIICDGKLLFGVGDFKAVYRQLTENPKVEIVALKPDGHWLRYTGKAVFETDPKYAEALKELWLEEWDEPPHEPPLDAMPNLRAIYNDKTGHKMMMFRIDDATAYDIPVMGEGVSLL